MQLIPNARVPILKSVSNRQGVSCDISVDNLQGLVKSKFLFWISEIDDRFRDMVLLVSCCGEIATFTGIKVLADVHFKKCWLMYNEVE